MMRAFIVFVFLACVASGCAMSPPEPTPTPGVGPAGGTVRSGDGLATLDVPAGALASEVLVQIALVTSPPLDAAAIRSSAYEITPVGVAFQAPARLTINFQPALRPSGTPANELRLHRVVDGQWAIVAGAQDLDDSAHLASAPVTSGGTYGVRWPWPSAPCTAIEDRQFDFWLGEWTFSQSFPVTGGGTNSITADPTGCLIVENFTSSGGRGHSLSLFSRLDGKWHQTYVDLQNNRVVLVGSFDGTRMVLDQSPVVRWIWEPLAAGDVRYWSEQTSDGVNWPVVFDSRYIAR